LDTPTDTDRRPATSTFAWLAILAVAVYLVAFFRVPFDSTTDMPRWVAFFVWLFQPEQLLAEWVGNDAARFGLLDRLPVAATAVAILSVAYLAGRLVLSGLRLDHQLDRLEIVVLATGVGANLLSLATLLLGLTGQLHNRAVLVGLGVVVIGLAAWRRRAWRVAQRPAVTHATLAKVALAVCVPFALVILLGAMVPPWHFDVREYHLQVPKEWYQQGRIDFMPHNIYGNMPLGAEMHALAGMVVTRDWWLGALVGKTIIALFAPLTALALYCFGRRFLCTTAGAVAAAVYLSTPWTASVSMTGLIEGPYGFYFFAAVYASCLTLANSTLTMPGKRDDSEPLRLAGLAGFLAGAAVSCKYPALLFLVLPLAVCLAWFPQRRFQWRPLAAFVLAVALGCGLWLAKSYVLTGNPTYPLLYSLFDGKTRTGEKDLQWKQAHQTPPESLTLPHAWNSFRVLTLSSQYLHPLLIPLAVVGLILGQGRAICRPLGWLVLYVTVMWWLLTHRVDRFLFPLLPLLAVLAGVGAVWSSARPWRTGVLVLLVGSSVTSFIFDASRAVSDNRFLVALSDLRQDLPNLLDPPEPDAPRYTHRHDTHRYLNHTVRPGYRVLLVGEAQVFDFEVPVLYNTCFDDCVFEQLLQGRSTEERLAAFRAHRISHVFVFWRELDRYRSPGNYGYSDYVTPELMENEFVRTGLLREIPRPIDPNNSQLFEVVGWESWD